MAMYTYSEGNTEDMFSISNVGNVYFQIGNTPGKYSTFGVCHDSLYIFREKSK